MVPRFRPEVCPRHSRSAASDVPVRAILRWTCSTKQSEFARLRSWIRVHHARVPPAAPMKLPRRITRLTSVGSPSALHAHNSRTPFTMTAGHQGRTDRHEIYRNATTSAPSFGLVLAKVGDCGADRVRARGRRIDSRDRRSPDICPSSTAEATQRGDPACDRSLGAEYEERLISRTGGQPEQSHRWSGVTRFIWAALAALHEPGSCFHTRPSHRGAGGSRAGTRARGRLTASAVGTLAAEADGFDIRRPPRSS